MFVLDEGGLVLSRPPKGNGSRPEANLDRIEMLQVIASLGYGHRCNCRPLIGPLSCPPDDVSVDLKGNNRNPFLWLGLFTMVYINIYLKKRIKKNIVVSVEFGYDCV